MSTICSGLQAFLDLMLIICSQNGQQMYQHWTAAWHQCIYQYQYKLLFFWNRNFCFDFTFEIDQGSVMSSQMSAPMLANKCQ